MNNVIVIVILILILILQSSQTHNLESFTSEENQNNNQIEYELSNDRNNIFKYNGNFEYINELNKRINKITQKLQDKIKYINKFLSQHKKNLNMIDKLGKKAIKIESVYKHSDIAKINKNIKKIKTFYDKHISDFIKLENMNTELLVYIQIKNSSKSKSNIQSSIDFNLIDSKILEYNDLKKKINSEYAMILDKNDDN